MRIVNCIQGSEDWESLRRGKPTASRFKDILTPAKLELSTSAKTYAIELAAERLGIQSEPALPSFEMMRGTEMEPDAVIDYERRKGVECQQVGFVYPDETTDWGCSPDRLLPGNRILEVKCPKIETLIDYHLNGFPKIYRLQVQGQLWITGAGSCDFYAYHPDIEPFEETIYPEPKVFKALDNVMPQFVALVEKIQSQIQTREAVFNG